MGVEDYLLTSTVNGILAQRLVRRIEPTHAERYAALPEVIEQFGLRRFQPEGTIYLYRPVPSALTPTRSEEHTFELQSLMHNSYAVFCLKNKTTITSYIITVYDCIFFTTTTTIEYSQH